MGTMTNPMRRVCSYCKLEYGKGEPGAGVTHGMCPACSDLLQALERVGYTLSEANDLVIGVSEGKTNPYNWPLPAKPIGTAKVLALLGALIDWDAAHHQEQE
jgi:hypothetical protein